MTPRHVAQPTQRRKPDGAVDRGRAREVLTRGVVVLWLPVLLLTLLMPSRLPPFDGVPLDTWHEAGLLVLLVPFVFSRRLRAEVSRRLRARRAPLVAGVLGLAVLAKVVLLAVAPNAGFESCYRSTLAAPPSGDCEASYSDPLRLSGATRVDEKLKFGLRYADPAAAALTSRPLIRDGALTQSNWNLSFFNSGRFSDIHTDPMGVDRDRLPFSLYATGEVDVPDSGVLRVTYTGEGELKVGERSSSLPSSYEKPTTRTLGFDSGRHRLELRYRFDRVRRYGDPPQPTTNYATLVVDTDDGEPLRAVAPATSWQILAGLAAGIVAAAGIGLALLVVWLLRSYWWLAYAVVLLALLARGIDSPYELGPLGTFTGTTTYGLILAGLLAALLIRPGPRPMLFAWGAVAVVSTVRTWDDFPFMDVVLYPNGGDDPLTYQAHAYDILATGSLRGGEDVFLFQPGFRYVLFAGRVLLGPHDPWFATLAWMVLVAAVFFLTFRFGFAGDRSKVSKFAATVIGSLLLFLLANDQILGQVRVGLSEWVSWAALLFAAGLLLVGRRPAVWVAGAGLLGLAFTIRQNQLGLILVILAAFLVRVPAERRRTALACCAAFLVMGLLPLGHNLIYGGKLQLISSGAQGGPGYAPTVGVEVHELANVFSDERLRRRVHDHINRTLYLEPRLIDAARPDLRGIDTSKWVNGLELAWLAALVFAIARRRRLHSSALVMFAAPLAALVIYVYYDPFVYYPRHVIAGYLAFGLAALYAFSPVSRLDEPRPLRERMRRRLSTKRCTEPRPEQTRSAERPALREHVEPGRPPPNAIELPCSRVAVEGP
jgi:hypothetical protein